MTRANDVAYWQRSRRIWDGIYAGIWAVFLLVAAGLLLSACGSSTAPDALPSPSPAPSPEVATVHMLVKISVSQGGQRMTEAGVEANKDFKVSGTATQCLDGNDKQIACPFIPYWRVDQTAGFGANCTRFGNESDNFAIFNCTEPIRDAQFQACALDWDRKELGCDRVNLNIG